MYKKCKNERKPTKDLPLQTVKLIERTEMPFTSMAIIPRERYYWPIRNDIAKQRKHWIPTIKPNKQQIKKTVAFHFFRRFSLFFLWPSVCLIINLPPCHCPVISSANSSPSTVSYLQSSPGSLPPPPTFPFSPPAMTTAATANTCTPRTKQPPSPSPPKPTWYCDPCRRSTNPTSPSDAVNSCPATVAYALELHQPLTSSPPRTNTLAVARPGRIERETD